MHLGLILPAVHRGEQGRGVGGHAVWTLVSATCLLPRATSSFHGVQRALN